MKFLNLVFALATFLLICISNVSAETLKWEKCLQGLNHHKFECTSIKLPMDYEAFFNAKTSADYDGAWITMPLVKRLASKPKKRIGSILVNPGGPGISGIDTVVDEEEIFYGERIQERFDYIGFDPRGVGRTQPVRCAVDSSKSAQITDDLYPAISVNNESYWTALDRVSTAVNQCIKASGEIVHYMSTMDAAHDMEQIRIALGENNLNYIGFSYGTFLGLTYANLYPDHVGRMILDGVMDPLAYVGEAKDSRFVAAPIRLKSYLGAEDTLDQFFKACDKVGELRCAISGNSRKVFDDVYFGLEALAINAEPEDFSSADDRFNQFVNLVRDSLTSEESWPRLADVVASEREYLSRVANGEAITKDAEDEKVNMVAAAVNEFKNEFPKVTKAYPKIPQIMTEVEFNQPIFDTEINDEYYDRAWVEIASTYPKLEKKYPDVKGWFVNSDEIVDPILSYVDNSSLAIRGVICSDSANPLTKERWYDSTIEAQYLSAYRNAQLWLMDNYACLYWNANNRHRYTGPFSNKTAHGLLIMNTLADSATPYQGAKTVHQLQENSRLVSVSGTGHTTAGLSSCADVIASHFLLTGELPENDRYCEQDTEPFPSPKIFR